MDVLSHIELFAGCGGLSVGLDAAGFTLFMANELSPMAGETFAFNILGENLANLADNGGCPTKTLWIKSKFPVNDLKSRLRENPHDFGNGRNTDLSTTTDFKNKLVIGNIDHFLSFLAKNKNTCKKLRRQNVDLLSGGPPCQGFSLAGKREKDDHKNLLPLSFAKFAGLIQPKVVLLENVKGITSPFQAEDDENHYAWLEVAKAFALKGFVPVCMLLNSKYFDVPQNRPRFILVAFRKDIFDKLKERRTNKDATNLILLDSLMFYNKVRGRRNRLFEITTKDLNLYDIESDPDYFDGQLLPKIKSTKGQYTSAKQAISDIMDINRKYELSTLNSDYASKLNILFNNKFFYKPTYLQNHEPRKHSFKVQARFRVYQILNNLNGLRQDAVNVITGKEVDQHTLKNVFDKFKNEPLLVQSNNSIVFQKPKDLVGFKNYLQTIASKKHSQRAIREDEPAPAQMTIPDDLCHYDENQLRTLTVREMARFQSFPDWFVFRSKATTGGKQRTYEVPQYTQVGNAVPPLLAFELGSTISRLLKSINNGT